MTKCFGNQENLDVTATPSVSANPFGKPYVSLAIACFPARTTVYLSLDGARELAAELLAAMVAASKPEESA